MGPWNRDAAIINCAFSLASSSWVSSQLGSPMSASRSVTQPYNCFDTPSFPLVRRPRLSKAAFGFPPKSAFSFRPQSSINPARSRARTRNMDSSIRMRAKSRSQLLPFLAPSKSTSQDITLDTANSALEPCRLWFSSQANGPRKHN